MTSPRRGFSKERHNRLKAALTALAVGGFALAWAGFGRSREQLDRDAGTVPASPAAETPLPTVPVTRTPVPVRTPVAGGTPTPTVVVVDEEPAPQPTRAKRSRGS